MFQIECDVSNINYQNIIDFVLQNQIKKADPDLRPFLENISHCTVDIVQTFTNSVSEKNVQTAAIYAVNTYQDKLKEIIEKTFLKNGFTVNITSIALTAPADAQQYHIKVQFEILDCSNKIIKPFLSEKLFKNLFHIKLLTESIFALVETVAKKQQNFVEIKNLKVSIK